MNAAWLRFAEVCRESFSECDLQWQLIEACAGNEDIAWAVHFHLRGESIAWLNRPVPALGNAKPIELIGQGRENQVRECLWSMPC